MFRKIVAVALFISFIAMSTSGLMMMVIEKPSFTIQMHPVHKLFGIIMILSVIGHLSFNLKAIAIFGGVLICVLVLVYSVALNNKVPSDIATPMDQLAAEAESHE